MSNAPVAGAPPPIRTWLMPRGGAFGIAAGIAALATLLLGAGVQVPWFTATAGVAVVLGIPAFLLAPSGAMPGRSNGERLAAAVVVSVGLVMAVGLAINTGLPYAGVTRPLDPLPSMAALLVAWTLLGIWAWGRHPMAYRISIPRLSRRERVLVRGSVAVVALAIVGAVRLNNGAGGGVTWFMLVVAMAVFACLCTWRDSVRPGTIAFAIYCLSLALLFMTSLRGWLTTGHDVQTEFLLFQLTKHLGQWRMSSLRSAYNACLSITILPLMLWNWMRLADPAIFKVPFQLLFAFCPVMAYWLWTRVTTKAVALLGTVFFVSFVTFFQDMPMLNRQEIGFLFLTSALLVLFSSERAQRSRQRWFVGFCLGMVVAHYSTTYFAIGVLLGAWALRVAAPPLARMLRVVAPSYGERATLFARSGAKGHVLSLGPILVVTVASLLWTGPLTRTQGALSQAARTTLQTLEGHAPAVKSDDTGYSLVGGTSIPSATLLHQFEASAETATAKGRASGAYYPLAAVDAYPVAVDPPAVLPLTALGRGLGHLGLSAASFNDAVRTGSAYALQLLVLVGLLVVVSLRKRFKTPAEFAYLAASSVVMLGLWVLLPVLSVDYGLLRAFQQGLLLLAVFLAVGIMALVPRSSSRGGFAVATGIALLFFASATGVITQALGGYGPQLHLNNAGAYYSLYETQPQEVSAISWLNHQDTGTGQVPVQVDVFTFLEVQSYAKVPLDNTGILPVQILRNAYVLVAPSDLSGGPSLIQSGNIVTYTEPLGFLNTTKNLVYNDGTTRVYR